MSTHISIHAPTSSLRILTFASLLRDARLRWSSLGLIVVAGLSVSAVAAQTNSPATRPKLLAKEVFLRPDNGRPVATGFITYISRTKPVLMHCFGRED